MSEQKNIEGTKILSITDGNGGKHTFISEAEHEVYGLKLKYYMWLSRLFIFFSILSLSFFASASLVVFKMAPKVSVEPFLIINQDSSDGLVRYEPISYDMASKKQLMETFVKQYVLLRNTFISDPSEMMSRWFPGGMVNFLSSGEVFYQFFSPMEDTWRDLFRQKTVKEVEIISVGKLGGEKSPVWKVDFKTYELAESQRDLGTRGLVLKTRYWTASVTAYFIPERIFVSLRLINPLGFTVTRYSQTEVEIF